LRAHRVHRHERVGRSGEGPHDRVAHESGLLRPDQRRGAVPLPRRGLRGAGQTLTRDNSRMIAVGMMSGTSVDGIDVAAIDIDGDDVKVLSTGHRDYDDAIRTRILAAA